MRLYKHSITVDGKKVESDVFYTDVRVEGRRYRLPLFSSERLSQKFCDKLEVLLAQYESATGYERDVQQWLTQIPATMLKKFARMGLVSQQRTEGGKSLDKQLQDYKAYLTHKGDSKGYIQKSISRIQTLFAECRFHRTEDISDSKIQKYIHDEITTNKISQATGNHYVRAIKCFTTWMYRNDRVTTDPLKNLRLLRVVEKDKKRRPLTVDEIAYLLDWLVNHAPKRRSLFGFERAVLYRLALMTGLRADEIRHLTVASIDFQNKTLTLSSAYTKNRQTAALPIRDDLLADFKEFVIGKTPEAALFRYVTDKTADMIRADLDDAREHWKAQAKDDKAEQKRREKSDFLKSETETGEVDFHSLRHTYGTLLVAGGVDVKTAQTLMRHSSPMLTLGIYSHTVRGAEQAAVDKLPDFSKQAEAEQQKKKA